VVRGAVLHQLPTQAHAAHHALGAGKRALRWAHTIPPPSPEPLLNNCNTCMRHAAAQHAPPCMPAAASLPLLLTHCCDAQRSLPSPAVSALAPPPAPQAAAPSECLARAASHPVHVGCAITPSWRGMRS
jgi:hypothetical protein